ncbi:rhodanese-like domain-containing protein [Nonomuraea fuscirosea]|uniref:rhodanese-like domain-containing protein n=1 Tax=Nonomuraea fuscirosea TaxID=1291556 RepID=UPI002DDA99DC|nr:rhodanese-like domain-containing protein [Nonomuraea fuscirosea]WSA51948.1 rhodanese-like domain-containing protein [Nonomuraea fuscirosea]
MPAESLSASTTTGEPYARAAEIDALLARARAGYRRLRPAEAWSAVGRGAKLVDTRPEHQRRASGEIPGAVVIERNHLEWRLDPTCAARIPEASSLHTQWIVICAEGYSSSLAAAALRELGLHNATDVIGGFDAWTEAGLPTVRPARPTPPRGPGE